MIDDRNSGSNGNKKKDEFRDTSGIRKRLLENENTNEENNNNVNDSIEKLQNEFENNNSNYSNNSNYDILHKKKQKMLKHKTTCYRFWFEFMLGITVLITLPLILIVGICVIILAIIKAFLMILQKICRFICCCCWCCFPLSSHQSHAGLSQNCAHTVCGECCGEHSF